MFPSSLASRTVRLVQRFARFAVWSVVLGCGASFVRGELLVEHECGGLDRYIGTAGPLAAGFTFTEPTRIEAITGWMTGSDQMTISIAMDFPDRVIYSQEFTGSFIPGLPASGRASAD
jgi:hypothetical protein